MIPATLAAGTYTVSVRVVDNAGNWSGVGTAELTVTRPPNSAPTATPQTVTTDEDTAATITLAGTDADAADTLSFIVVAQPAHGVLSGTAPNLTYTPAANFNGPDSFTFTVNDGHVDSTTATVSITVTAVNDVPVANPLTLSATSGQPASVTLSGSDVEGDRTDLRDRHRTRARNTQPDPGPPAPTPVPPATQGPTPSPTRPTTAQSQSPPATVSITVTAAPNSAPTATPKTVTTNEDTAAAIVLTGTDPNVGDTLSFVVVTQPAHGALTGTAPNLTYTPAANYNGPDSFTFKVNDGHVDSTTATVSITVTPVNDAPVANPLTLTAMSGQPTSVTLTGSDIDSATLSFVILTGPTHGTLTGTGATRTYTSAIGYAGPDSFTFAANDSQSQSPPATVSITVTAPPGGLSLSLADNASRTTNLRPLAGAVLRSGASAYIFVDALRPADVRQVTFTLDGVAFSTDSLDAVRLCRYVEPAFVPPVRARCVSVRVESADVGHSSHHGDRLDAQRFTNRARFHVQRRRHDSAQPGRFDIARLVRRPRRSTGQPCRGSGTSSWPVPRIPSPGSIG